ncbi:MAG: arginine deiminase family protein [Oligoflexales bacterium]
MREKIHVTNEIGKLKSLLINVPNSGTQYVPPALQRELLYDDIVDYQVMRQEYASYHETLLWFLDPNLAKKLDSNEEKRMLQLDPYCKEYLNSDKVLDVAHLLSECLHEQNTRHAITHAVCAHERIPLFILDRLELLSPEELCQTLLTGCFEQKILFPPIPNLLFTRDIGVVLENVMACMVFKKSVRAREALLLQYLAYFGLRVGQDSLVQIEYHGWATCSPPPSIEGGDVMMISPDHLLVGRSERTNGIAIESLLRKVSERTNIKKVSVIDIPKERGCMHIDTLFTQLKRDTWAIYGPVSQPQESSKTIEEYFDGEIARKHAICQQFSVYEDSIVKNCEFSSLQELLTSVSKDDFGASECKFIYCADQDPYQETREQWTDACNFLALDEGIILGYERNRLTNQALENNGFDIIHANELNKQLRQGAALETLIDGDTLIVFSSAELSRARGGSHCMSFPLAREDIYQKV